MKRVAVILLVLLVASIGALTQGIPAPGSRPRVDDVNEFKLTTDVELVLLDISVKDNNGGFVSGLKREAFKVFENNVEQSLSVFAAQDVPITVGLVVDNSGSVRPKKPEIVTAALTLVAQSNPKDEVFVVNFNDQVMMGLPDGVDFTGDRALLRQALLTSPAQGRTALYDAIKTGLEYLDKGRLDKKTLVVISDGGDNSSDTTKKEIMSLIDGSLSTIYAVGVFNPDDHDKNPGFLKRIASVSGGEAFMPDNLSDLVGVCEKIAQDIRNRYTVGYTPKNLTLDGKTRKLKVVASSEDGRKLVIRTRTHYTATARTSNTREVAK